MPIDEVKTQEKMSRAMQQTHTQARKLSSGIDEVSRSTRRMGANLRLSELSFGAVGEAVATAALKVGLWVVATGVVMGTVAKLGQVIQLWRDLEVTLARIGITTSTLGDDLYKYFALTADVARSMGMPIEMTLRGMDLALRATSKYGEGVKRTAIATLMLRDAAILGNVAGMNFDQAIDILVGSLRQTGMELNQGIILLDKWVAVAKTAAVSVNDLSQGFAIMSSAAASAGLNVDQVNGIIAALSEAVTLGPIEVGNAVRALMATLYNPGSIAMLNRFGVAVKDATGEFRSFWDVMTELSSMHLTGALSEDQILKIAKAAGAGQRRYAQFIALLKNWEAAMRTSEISANAQGDALDANERIVQTLTNTWDKFTAAQNKFFFALGEKSGMIEGLTNMLQLAASAFGAIASWNEPMMRTIKVVAELGAAIVALKVFLLLLTKVGVIAWAGKMWTSFIALAGALAGVRAAGIGAGMAAAPYPGVVAPAMMAPMMAPGVTRGAFGGFRAGPTYRGAGGQFVSQQQAYPYMAGRGAMIAPMPMGGVGGRGQAWAGLGRGLIRPRGLGLGALAGGAAAGLITREITDSNWAGIGSLIGGAAGMALGGPVGLVAGGAIGGVIASMIEDSATSLETKLGEYKESLLEGMSTGFQDALKRAAQAEVFKGLIVPEVEEGEELRPYAEEVGKTREELLKTLREYQEAPWTKGIEKEYLSLKKKIGSALWWAIPGVQPWEGKPTDVWDVGQEKELYGRYEIAKKNYDQAILMQQQQEAINAATEGSLGLQNKIALKAKEIVDLLGLEKITQEKLDEAKAKALELTDEEYEALLTGIGAALPAYSRLFAQLKLLTPTLAKQFEELYPYEKFIGMEPEAFAPLREVLGSIITAQDTVVEQQKRIADIGWLLGGEPPTLDTITARYEYWKWLSDGLLINDQLANEELDRLNSQLDASNQLTKEGAELYAVKLQLAIDAFDIIEKSNRAEEVARSMAERRFKYAGEYIEPGRLAFFEPDQVGKADIGAMIEKYKGMFEGYISSQPQIYHAFIRDLEGSVSGYFETFETYPEVWQAMLTELQAIEQNTSQLEATYNIPSQYAVPSRYQYYESTGAREFGPLQKGLWATWEEFKKESGLQAGIPYVPRTGAYYLHKGEAVLGGGFNLNTTNAVLRTSQGYLASINLGISALKQTMNQLVSILKAKGQVSVRETSGFERQTRAGGFVSGTLSGGRVG
jgi:TP901 family phage tail tape measure protein